MKNSDINNNKLSINKSSFGLLSSGKEAHLFTLSNNENSKICITNYGGIIVSLEVEDKKGSLADVVLGYDSITGYEKDPYYLGAIIGRYAGRIKQGNVVIKNQHMNLSLNHENSQLHGGKDGLNKQLWQAEIQTSSEAVSLVLTHTSPDGHNGFDGEVAFCVKYSLNNNNELSVEYFAETDKTTLINLTQHSYFNLAGHDQGNIQQHQIKLNADHFLPMTIEAYPTGEIQHVKDTPHDFTQLIRLADAIDETDEQIKIGKGYDNYWLLNTTEEIKNLRNYAVQVVEPNSGRRLTLYTDQPSIILYTGNYLDGSQKGKSSSYYQTQHGLCLEPQRAFDHSLADKIYQPFSTCVLEPNKPFYSKSVYVFDTV